MRSEHRPRLWHRLQGVPDVHLLLLLLASLFAVAPFVMPGYFWNANDARHDAYFIFEYDRSVREGILLPRWSPDFAFGFGYPFFNIYAPLAVQVGEVFHLLGLGFTQAVEAVFVLSIFLSALAMYGFLRGWLGPAAALVGGVTYVYVPYHLFDMYQRAAMAESFSFVWLPLVLWGARAAVERPGRRSVWGLGLAYAGLMLTSNLVAVLFTPVLAGYVLVLVGAKALTPHPARLTAVRALLGPTLGGLAGLGLSAWFWLPALAEFKYVNQQQWYGGYYDFHQHFVYFFQLFSPHWGFGISVPGPNDVISYQLGLAPYLLALGGWWAIPHLPDRESRWQVRYFLLVGIAATFLTTGASAWFWDHVPGVAFAQFPWRYLMLTAVALSVLVATALWLEGGRARSHEGHRVPVLALAMAGVVLLGSWGYTYVQVQEPLPEQGPVGLPALMRFQASEDEMTGVTAFAKEVPRWSPLAEVMVHGRDVRTKVDYGRLPDPSVLAVDSREYSTVHEKVWFRANQAGQKIVFAVQMYPGWTAYILDERTEEVEQVIPWTELEVTDPYGFITVPVPEGRHFLLLRFEDTPVRKVGKGVTVVTLAVMAWTWAWRLVRSRI